MLAPHSGDGDRQLEWRRGWQYILVEPSGLSANITPLAITVAATGINKAYDGTVTGAVTLAGSGMLAGDAVKFTDTSASFAKNNVGNGKTVSVSGIAASGTDAGNYKLNNTTASATTYHAVTLRDQTIWPTRMKKCTAAKYLDIALRCKP